MTLRSKITSVEPTGTWSNGQKTFNKFRVCFANGDNLNFLAVNNFLGQVGQDLTYTKNEVQGTGKIFRDNVSNGITSRPNNIPAAPSEPVAKKEDTQTYIIRQSMLKAAIDYHAAFGTSTFVAENQVMETARNFVNFVNNG
jgi:hypothetical protein